MMQWKEHRCHGNRFKEQVAQVLLRSQITSSTDLYHRTSGPPGILHTVQGLNQKKCFDTASICAFRADPWLSGHDFRAASSGENLPPVVKCSSQFFLQRPASQSRVSLKGQLTSVVKMLSSAESRVTNVLMASSAAHHSSKRCAPRPINGKGSASTWAQTLSVELHTANTAMATCSQRLSHFCSICNSSCIPLDCLQFLVPPTRNISCTGCWLACSKEQRLNTLHSLPLTWHSLLIEGITSRSRRRAVRICGRNSANVVAG